MGTLKNMPILQNNCCLLQMHDKFVIKIWREEWVAVVYSIGIFLVKPIDYLCYVRCISRGI